MQTNERVSCPAYSKYADKKLPLAAADIYALVWARTEMFENLVTDFANYKYSKPNEISISKNKSPVSRRNRTQKY